MKKSNTATLIILIVLITATIALGILVGKPESISNNQLNNNSNNVLEKNESVKNNENSINTNTYIGREELESENSVNELNTNTNTDVEENTNTNKNENNTETTTENSKDSSTSTSNLTGKDKAIDLVKKTYATQGQKVTFDHMESANYVIKVNEGTAITWYLVDGTTWEVEEY